jgi:hypothetical protein
MLDRFLDAFTQELDEKLRVTSSLVDEVMIHPGSIVLQTPEKTKGIYTLLGGTDQITFIETGENDLTAQPIVYILVKDPPETLRIQKNRIGQVQNILAALVSIISLNRWGLDYAFPAKNIKTIDLYGLTYAPNQLVGTQGWNPSLQAYAKDLYSEKGKDPQGESEPLPDHISLWAVTWEQVLRISHTQESPNPPAARDVHELFAFSSTSSFPTEVPIEQYEELYCCQKEEFKLDNAHSCHQDRECSIGVE